MRNLLIALLVVGLLAAPSMGAINIRLISDKASIGVGQTATISIQAQADSGVFALGGRVTGDNAGVSTVAGSMVFDPNFNPASPFGPRIGVAGTNGGWGTSGTANGWGTQQTNWNTPDGTIGLTPAWVTLGSYTVTGVTANTVDNLTFATGSYGGYKATEVNKGTSIGTNVGTSITVTPEPVTLALLALGGLLIRRRSH